MPEIHIAVIQCSLMSIDIVYTKEYIIHIALGILNLNRIDSVVYSPALGMYSNIKLKPNNFILIMSQKIT